MFGSGIERKRSCHTHDADYGVDDVGNEEDEDEANDSRVVFTFKIIQEEVSNVKRAAMAMEPIQLPTKMVSTRIFSDITKIPIDAGTACFINKLPMESVPNLALWLGFIRQLRFLHLQCAIGQSSWSRLRPNHHGRLNREQQ